MVNEDLIEQICSKELEEFRQMSKEDLIEEVYRLRIIVLKGNARAYKKARENVLREFPEPKQEVTG